MTARARTDEPRVVVFAPAPLLTVTVERKGEDPEIHLHAGGQGFWVARMVAALGVPVTVCGSFGGEVGAVVRTLMEREGLHVAGIEADVGNPAYIHDRRSGTRDVVAEVQPGMLSRHELDELYGVTLIEALEAAVCVVAGSSGPPVVPADTYRRLAADLRGNDRLVVADLAGDARRAVLASGVRALKVSHEELLVDGVVATDSIEELLGGLETLRAAGAADVVISRADRPAIATCDGAIVEVKGPRLEPLEARGAGDALTAGIAAALARGENFAAGLRLGTAAGALNVTRRGIASGHREEIERLAAQIVVSKLLAGRTPAEEMPRRTETPDELADRARPT